MIAGVTGRFREDAALDVFEQPEIAIRVAAFQWCARG